MEFCRVKGWDGNMAGINKHRDLCAAENNALCAAHLQALDDLVIFLAGCVDDLTQTELIVNDAMNLNSIGFVWNKNVQAVLCSKATDVEVFFHRESCSEKSDG